MASGKGVSVTTTIGRQVTDSIGSPLGVARMDAGRSYAGVGQLLQHYIDNANEEAWLEIRFRIDYTYQNLDLALAALDEETGFGREIRARIATGQKLLIKPNLVTIHNIDPQTHGPGQGSTACTEWPFVAALMRWFHDRLDISYHQMALGEAATTMPSAASLFTMMNPARKQVTPEATIEGRVGDFYGGWGFYFVRKYLAETHDPAHNDDPMKGYEESVSGTYIPPGLVRDRLMVYDLNRIFDEPSKGRDVIVPQGVNFSSIILHKAVVGGYPDDPDDRNAYPGSVLVNVPKLKVHQLTLLTGAIKNPGIGLYPMQVHDRAEDRPRWRYGVPSGALPGLKARIPHAPWAVELDEATGIPQKDRDGKYTVTKSGGLVASITDMLAALHSQGIFMLHVVDAIEIINRDHTGTMPGTRESEGLVVAGLDPVAIDLLCARYMFSNVSMADAYQSGLDDGNGGFFPQRVPVPRVEGDNIITGTGYDCPLRRDASFRYAEQRSLGKRSYYIMGGDAVLDRPLASVGGRPGSISEGSFSELVTSTIYFDVFKVAWDLQQMCFAYLEAVDRLAGTSRKKELLDALDEDGDGAISYDEFSRNGIVSPIMHLMGLRVSIEGSEKFGYHHGAFLLNATLLRLSNPLWNPGGHDILKHFYVGPACLAAYTMSQLGLEAKDPFLPSLTWGKGKWPSYELAAHMQRGVSIYGNGFPLKAAYPSLYGHVFRYADLTQNKGFYSGRLLFQPKLDGVQEYLNNVQKGAAAPLNFTLYVPPEYGTLLGSRIPNVAETTDPAMILTASFEGGREVW